MVLLRILMINTVMVKLLLQGVGCVCGCMVLWGGFFGVLVALNECEGYDPYSATPAEDEVIDGLEAAGKGEVAELLCGNTLPPTVGSNF